MSSISVKPAPLSSSSKPIVSTVKPATSSAPAKVATTVKAAAPTTPSVAKAATAVAKNVSSAVKPTTTSVAKAATAVAKNVSSAVKAAVPTTASVAKAATAVAKNVSSAAKAVAKSVSSKVVDAVKPKSDKETPVPSGYPMTLVMKEQEITFLDFLITAAFFSLWVYFFRKYPDGIVHWVFGIFAIIQLVKIFNDLKYFATKKK